LLRCVACALRALALHHATPEDALELLLLRIARVVSKAGERELSGCADVCVCERERESMRACVRVCVREWA
jgi:hypothetical protein